MCNRKGADDNRHMAEEPRAWKARTRGSEAEVDGVIRPSTVTGRCYAVGCARIGTYPKRNSRSTWGSSSSCITSASEVKRCWARSLSYSSHKTPESNKSVLVLKHPVWHDTGGGCHSSCAPSGVVALSRA